MALCCSDGGSGSMATSRSVENGMEQTTALARWRLPSLQTTVALSLPASMATTRLPCSTSPLRRRAIAMGRFWLPPLKVPMSRFGGTAGATPAVAGAAGVEPLGDVAGAVDAPVRVNAVTAPRLTACQWSAKACCSSETSREVVP